jgi:hypothetical protein
MIDKKQVKKLYFSGNYTLTEIAKIVKCSRQYINTIINNYVATIPQKTRNEKMGKKCEVCGTAFNLQFHHKDRNRSNNNKENIAILCLDCHRIEHEREKPTKDKKILVPYLFKRTVRAISRKYMIDKREAILRMVEVYKKAERRDFDFKRRIGA